MPPSNRAAWRNVYICDASDETILGGFYQAGCITEETLIYILDNILLAVEDSWAIRHRESDRTITPSRHIVELGHYDIYCQGNIIVSDEDWVYRLTSYSLSGQPENAFTNGVRTRDGKCVITGEVNEIGQFRFWAGFHAAHVFPLEDESRWVEHGYSRWITNLDNTMAASGIDSVQNGLLMGTTFHQLFDQYLISINPDDGYKIVIFIPGHRNIDGRVLDPICRDPNDPNRVSGEVLRWHFRQSVLANMRGAGQPIFEYDFPPCTDKVATLRSVPYGKEIFELELASRLRSTP